jgi:TrmH family RNA methyltransferase
MALLRIGLQHPATRRLLAVQKNGTSHSRSFVVEGAWAHDRLLAAGMPVDVFLWCRDLAVPDRVRACAEKVAAASRASYLVSPRTLARLSAREKPDGLVSLAGLPTWDPDRFAFGERAIVLVADGIEYAGNLGTLVRTVDAARADCLVLTNRRARLTHPKVFSASRGTVLTTPVIEFDRPAEAADWLEAHGFDVYLADPGSTRGYRTCSYAGAPTAFVVGSEGGGLGRAW